MGYKVKWVEDNLGVSRKALRNFEEKGLMPKNKEGRDRDYDDDDLQRIWSIRVLQGMGYKLNEIVDMEKDENLDFECSIGEKIEQLEKEKIKIERHLNYAKTIKFTGRFPLCPKEMGSVQFDDFHEKMLNEWNIVNDPQMEQFQTFADIVLTKMSGEWKDTDWERMLELLSHINYDEKNVEGPLTEQVLLRAIGKRMHLGIDHPEVQLLVKLIYDNQRDYVPELIEMSPKQFARLHSSNYIVGDIARINELKYGKNECNFIADAIAVFGGYLSFGDPKMFGRE